MSEHITRVLVCCGVGGVGKTTTAAALAVGEALSGKRVVVMTIDPARRLADALGLAGLDNKPRPVDLTGLGGPPGASLHALMLDRKGTWDEAVHRFSPSPEAAEKLLENRYYKAVSERLTGSHEYMAIEKLHSLVESAEWDLVVVDTPPTQHALEFFEAPDRVRRVLDRSVLKFLIEPQKGWLGSASDQVTRRVGRLVGDKVLEDISEFFKLLSGLSSSFRERSTRVRDLMRADTTRYLLVANARNPTRSDVLEFLDAIREKGMRFDGFVVNRVAVAVALHHKPTAENLPPAPEGVDEALWDEVIDALIQLPALQEARSERHRRDAARLAESAGHTPVWLVPEQGDGLRTLAGLAEISRHLPPFSPPSAR